MAEPPNQTLQFFLNLLWRKASDPKSGLYLPDLILSRRDPAYDPYTVDGSWHLENNTSLADAATSICTAYDPNPDSVGQPDGVPDIWLVDAEHALFKAPKPFVVKGASNVTLSQPIVVDGTTATATATFGALESRKYGRPTVQGNWTLTQHCRDNGTPYEGDGFGYVDMVINSATVDCRLTVSAVGSDQLVVTVDALKFSAAASPDNVVVDVQLMEITDPNLRAMWNDVADTAFKDATTLRFVVGKIAEIMDSQATRDEIGRMATDALRRIIDGTSAA